MHLQPLKDAPFGAVASGLDCASIDSASIEAIRDALHRDQIVVVPDQGHLTPQQEVIFYRTVYPEGTSVWRDQSANPWERFKVEQGNQAGTYQIPSEPGVLVLGKGQIDHYGLKVMLGGDRAAYGAASGSQVLGGGVMQWHIDGAFYGHAPGCYTQMRCIEAPEGEGHWLDYLGDGNPLWCPPGATAFASGRIAYKSMSDQLREQCLNSLVHYLPKPFESTYQLKNSENGLRVVDAKSETLYKMGCESPGVPFSDPDTQRYPLVWTCPDTGYQALMPQPRCLGFLEIKQQGRRDRLGITKSRMLIESLMLPAVISNQVYVHDWKEGDLVIWNNRSVWHSATGRLASESRRVMHLTAFNAGRPPKCFPQSGLSNIA